MRKYDIQADWVVNQFCNFRCKYCCSEVSKVKQFAPFVDNKKIIDGFNGSGVIWSLNMGATEPFFQPHFVELCKELTKKHYLSANTNLSARNVYDFADQIDPDRIPFLHCSLHIDERERLNLVNDFVEKIRYLKMKGFNVFVSQVMYPSAMKRFEKISNFFLEKEIVVRPKIFRGYFHGRHYPDSYSPKEREKLAKYLASAEENYSEHILMDLNVDNELLYGELSFEGLPCDAGKDFVIIEQNGDVLRCWSDPVKLGNVFENRLNLHKASKLCPSKICHCPYHGMGFAKGKHRIVKADGVMKHIGKKLSSIPANVIRKTFK